MFCCYEEDPTRPHLLIGPLPMGQAFTHMSPWGPDLFKPPHWLLSSQIKVIESKQARIISQSHLPLRSSLSYLGFCRCAKTPWPKTTWERKGLFHPTLRTHFITEETQAEALEECYLVACFTWLAQPVFLQPRTTCPGVALPAVGWALLPPTSIINQENAHKLAYRPISWGDIFSFKSLSSQIVQVCVKMKKNRIPCLLV